MKKILMTLAIVLCCWMTMPMLTSCSSDNEDNPTTNPTDSKALVGTWVGDLTGKTFSIWSYGKAWNVWTFNADGTGVSDVYFLAGDEPVAIQHQPFTYTAEDGKLVTVMEDGSWDWTYQAVDGKLTIDYEGGNAMTFDKANAAQTTQFTEWSRRELLSVPGLQARYTMFVYGNAGGDMDDIIEKDFWEAVRPYLKDSTKVRVAVLYKYGQNTSGQMTDDGDVVWFELNSETDLDRLHEEGLNALGMHTEAIATKLYDPNTIHQFIEFSSLFCPAEEYIFTIWGHGSGFDPRNDIPDKYNEKPAATRGVIGDEWNDEEQLDMYELSQAIKATGRAPLKAIFFNNCLMGNMESLTELRDVAEYIACSAHLLSGGYIVLPAFIRRLIEKDNVEDAFAYMLNDITPGWQNSYKDDENLFYNGDFKLLRTSELDGIIDVTRRLADRVVALYPTQKETIDLATKQVYRFYTTGETPEKCYIDPFFDLQDYADKLAANTGDAELTAIAADLRTAFVKAILQYVDVNWSVQHLDHYSLSVCLYHQDNYNYDFIGNGKDYKSNIGEGYEKCTFHKLTGWGNFLRINTGLPWGNPTCGGGGPINAQ
ncbi:MAG: hypothetical protein IKO73_02085 [Bacteroidaceae bacterium]|nr:hypothetical protein [Bacteroidaceae bacterium]MBR6844588.1 hypothetical protein [Bacteroidales bacterium]